MDQIATRKVNGRAKDLKAIEVKSFVLWCYREHKFPPGDPMHECHLGLKSLDLDKCVHCRWFGEHPNQQRKLLTGPEAMIVASALKTIRETSRRTLQ